MSQSKRQSWGESITQNVVGYFVGLGTQYVVFPLYGMEIDLIANLQIGIIFAIVSTIRSYLLRRVFNKQHVDERILLAALSQRDGLIIELQKENIAMTNYIKRVDGIL
jgi:hypothetical protein